jgi:cell division protein FtsN
MTRDYKAREKIKPRHGRRGGSSFFWFVTGALFGAFGVGFAWMLQNRMPLPVNTDPQTRTEQPAKPNFVFHQLLPELEVLVPEEELSAASQTPIPPKPKASLQETPPTPKQERPDHHKPTSAEQPDTPLREGASYVVQVASFRNPTDAERLKAQLALLGIQVRIERVTINGRDYYRVRTGPYKGKQEVSETLALLSSNGLESIAIRLK